MSIENFKKIFEAASVLLSTVQGRKKRSGLISRVAF